MATFSIYLFFFSKPLWGPYDWYIVGLLLTWWITFPNVFYWLKNILFTVVKVTVMWLLYFITGTCIMLRRKGFVPCCFLYTWIISYSIVRYYCFNKEQAMMITLMAFHSLKLFYLFITHSILYKFPTLHVHFLCKSSYWTSKVKVMKFSYVLHSI